MKKRVLLLCLIPCAVIYSCTKEQNNAPGNNTKSKYQVKFQINILSVETGDINKTGVKKLAGIPADIADSLKRTVSYLYYTVYNGTTGGSFIRQLDQDSSMLNFGTITDSLPDGDYTVTLIASKEKINLTANKVESAQPRTVYWATLPGTDVFFRKFRLGIKGAGVINQQVSLPRLVSKLDVEFENPLPTTAYQLKISAGTSGWRNQFFLLDSTLSKYNNYADFTYVFKDSEKGKPNFKLTFYPLANSLPDKKLSFTVIKSTGEVISSKVVEGVDLPKNRRTYIHGKFFDDVVTNKGMQVFVDSKWGEDINVQF